MQCKFRIGTEWNAGDLVFRNARGVTSATQVPGVTEEGASAYRMNFALLRRRM